MHKWYNARMQHRAATRGSVMTGKTLDLVRIRPNEAYLITTEQGTVYYVRLDTVAERSKTRMEKVHVLIATMGREPFIETPHEVQRTVTVGEPWRQDPYDAPNPGRATSAIRSIERTAMLAA